MENTKQQTATILKRSIIVLAIIAVVGSALYIAGAAAEGIIHRIGPYGYVAVFIGGGALIGALIKHRSMPEMAYSAFSGAVNGFIAALVGWSAMGIGS